LTRSEVPDRRSDDGLRIIERESTGRGRIHDPESDLWNERVEIDVQVHLLHPAGQILEGCQEIPGSSAVCSTRRPNITIASSAIGVLSPMFAHYSR
jgi:hypothetical protein